jgi:hypothetical protein
VVVNLPKIDWSTPPVFFPVTMEFRDRLSLYSAIPARGPSAVAIRLKTARR